MSQSETKRVVLERFPFRLYKALKVYAAMNEIQRFESAIYRVLESDIVVQHIILQFRDNAKAEEIKRVSKDQVMKEINQQGRQ